MHTIQEENLPRLESSNSNTGDMEGLWQFLYILSAVVYIIFWAWESCRGLVYVCALVGRVASARPAAAPVPPPENAQTAARQPSTSSQRELEASEAHHERVNRISKRWEGREIRTKKHAAEMQDLRENRLRTARRKSRLEFEAERERAMQLEDPPSPPKPFRAPKATVRLPVTQPLERAKTPNVFKDPGSSKSVDWLDFPPLEKPRCIPRPAAREPPQQRQRLRDVGECKTAKSGESREYRVPYEHKERAVRVKQWMKASFACEAKRSLRTLTIRDIGLDENDEDDNAGTDEDIDDIQVAQKPEGSEVRKIREMLNKMDITSADMSSAMDTDTPALVTAQPAQFQSCFAFLSQFANHTPNMDVSLLEMMRRWLMRLQCQQPLRLPRLARLPRPLCPSRPLRLPRPLHQHTRFLPVMVTIPLGVRRCKPTVAYAVRRRRLLRRTMRLSSWTACHPRSRTTHCLV